MPLPKRLQDKWDEAEKTNQPVKIGEIVVCDICSKDYTNRPDSGGFVFGDKGCCPKCSSQFLITIKSYGEEKYIKAYCPAGESFADFIRKYRGADAAIRIIRF